MQKAPCTSIMDELNIDMSSPHSFISKISTFKPNDERISSLGEELEWNAIAQDDTLEKAKSYIYSFFLNHSSYDLECFLTKKGISTNLVPSYTDYYLSDDKEELEEDIDHQISVLSSKFK